MLIKSSSKELKLKCPQGSFALIWTIDNPLYLSDNPIQDAYVDKSALKKESTFVGQRKYLRLLLLLLVLLLLQIFLWQEQIEHYCKEEYYGYAVVGKDGTNNLGEDVEHACGLGETKTYAERKTHDDHIALRESATSHHAEACIENAAKHHYGASTKYSLRNRR